MQRIARTEHELATVTAEFTEGFEARFGPLPCLHEAQEAMEAAAAALDQKNATTGRDQEGTALAGLIKARQNIRKLLSQSSSSSASQCRKFDQEQNQKLRPPKKAGAEKERLAKLQDEIEQLAKEEKKFSEEIESKSGGGAQMEQSESDAQKKEQPAKSQSSSSSSSSKGQKSSQSKADLAQQLAKEQQGLSNQMEEKQGKPGQQGKGESQATAERSLSQDAQTLADLLNRNIADAAEADRELGQALREASEKNPPAAIAEQMKQIADALRAGKKDQAKRDANDSDQKLDALAQQLDATRRALIQPQLEKLVAAEKQAAEAQKALN